MTISTRNHLPDFLIAQGCGAGRGAELGVAAGTFSAHLLAGLPDLETLWSIDAWEGDRGHDAAQCALATRRLAPFADRSRILQARFDTVVEDFPDESLDFIYIDGYAHEGNFSSSRGDGPSSRQAGQDDVASHVASRRSCGDAEGVSTFDLYWPKVRRGGGVFAGHDYHPQWPANIAAVDAFYAAHAAEVDDFFLTSRDKFPSWVMVRG